VIVAASSSTAFQISRFSKGRVSKFGKIFGALREALGELSDRLVSRGKE